MSFYKKYILAGKSIPLWFYIRTWGGNLLPRSFWNWRRRQLTRNWESRDDADYIRTRRDIYCRLNETVKLPDEKVVNLGDVNERNFQSRYGLDAFSVLKYFPKQEKVIFCDGDVWENPVYPSLIKCRRLNGENENNAVILNLDSIRHWLDPKDNIPFKNKVPKLFFRGDIYNKPTRIKFFEQWADNPLFDLGDTTRSHPSKWHADFVTIPDHFNYQFILALEGFDMASSLQWIMASNCVPVMPKPTVEGWLMHSRLQPGVHYIEIAPDFSDAGEKIDYYVQHPEEAEKIAMESKKWAQQFRNKKREKLISILVVEKYLKFSKQ